MNEAIINEILEKEHTPLYVFNIGKLKQRVRLLREGLPKGAELCYAVKANPFLAAALTDQVEWMEICSPGELRICRKLEIPEKKFVVSGVYKDASTMKNLLEEKKQVGYYTVESAGQFTMLRNMAERFQKKIPLILRLTSGNQFGLDEYELAELVRLYKNDRWVEICGLQYFSGTQKSSLKKLSREIRNVDNYLTGLEQMYDFKMPKLEFGPGLPVPYFEGESLNESEFLEEFSLLLSEMRYNGAITLEVGRSIAASCGTYLTQVVDTKRNHGENYAIVDGGMHQMVYYGQSMAMKHPHFSVFPVHPTGEEQEWNICGSLCTINDFLVKKVPLPGLQKGDILAFENAGAYCMTEGISLFLSRDLPAVALLDENGNYSLVREHTAIDELNMPQYKKKKGERKL